MAYGTQNRTGGNLNTAQAGLGAGGGTMSPLTTTNPVFAMDIANELEKENNKRKDITSQITNEAINMVEKECNLEGYKSCDDKKQTIEE